MFLVGQPSTLAGHRFIGVDTKGMFENDMTDSNQPHLPISKLTCYLRNDHQFQGT